eukprot:scaffold13655_cov114-Isochrysis_galbana.AAC.2
MWSGWCRSPGTFSISKIRGRAAATAARKAGVPSRASRAPSRCPRLEKGWQGGPPERTNGRAPPAISSTRIAGSGSVSVMSWGLAQPQRHERTARKASRCAVSATREGQPRERPMPAHRNPQIARGDADAQGRLRQAGSRAPRPWRASPAGAHLLPYNREREEGRRVVAGSARPGWTRRAGERGVLVGCDPSAAQRGDDERGERETPRLLRQRQPPPHRRKRRWSPQWEAHTPREDHGWRARGLGPLVGLWRRRGKRSPEWRPQAQPQAEERHPQGCSGTTAGIPGGCGDQDRTARRRGPARSRTRRPLSRKP